MHGPNLDSRVQHNLVHAAPEKLLGQWVKELLALQRWNRVYHSTDTETVYFNFIYTLTTIVLDIACPKTSSRNNSYKHKKHELLHHDSNLLRRQFLETEDRFVSTKCHGDREEAVARTIAYDLATNKHKAIWRTVNNECEVIDDVDMVSSTFNEYFTTIAEETEEK
ncbi:hypothetical protein J6590_092058 [Homalodisca vitripennis]|nr:hypothetical protein J6590_092058 [Homalodisca vitripennis]